MNKLFKLRLSIFKSNNHIYCQVINDKSHHTIVSCSTRDKEILKKFLFKKINNCITANLVGKKLGRLLKKNLITEIYYDNKYSYKGKVKALIEGIRSVGISI
jgi:large subunit ribosomal protein L18